MRALHAVLASTGILLLALVVACSGQTAAPPPPPTTVTIVQPPPPPTPSPGYAGDGCFASYQTTQASVLLCRESGQIYYHGTSSGGSIQLPATEVGKGICQTVPNDGYTYTISSHALVIKRYGAVISTQLVVSTDNGATTTTPRVPSADEACSRFYPRGSVEYQQCTATY